MDAVLPNYASYGYDLTELMAAENPVLDGKTYNDVANPTLMEAVKSAGGTDEILAVPYTPTCSTTRTSSRPPASPKSPRPGTSSWTSARP